MKSLLVVICLLCLWSALPASADEVVLDNGTILKGKVTEGSGETVVITSDYAEPIKVKKGRVTKITIDTPAEVRLTNGEVLKGKLATGADGRIAVDQADGRGATTVDWASVAALNPPPPKPWKGSVTAGGNIQSGNNNTAALSFGAEAVRRGDNDRFSLQFLYTIARASGGLSARNAFGAVAYNYFFTRQLYGLVSVSLLNDTFQDLNLRAIVGPGVGYQVWDDKKKSLSLEAGVSYLSEDLKLNPDKSWFTARLAGNVTYQLTDTVLFSDQLILYPSLEKMSDFQLRNEAALLTSLGAAWSLKLANIIDYVNSPPAGKRTTDSNVILGIQFGF